MYHPTAAIYGHALLGTSITICCRSFASSRYAAVGSSSNGKCHLVIVLKWLERGSKYCGSDCNTGPFMLFPDFGNLRQPLIRSVNCNGTPEATTASLSWSKLRGLPIIGLVSPASSGAFSHLCATSSGAFQACQWHCPDVLCRHQAMPLARKPKPEQDLQRNRVDGELVPSRESERAGFCQAASGCLLRSVPPQTFWVKPPRSRGRC